MSEVLAVYTDIIMRKGGMKSMQELGKDEEHMK